MYGHTVILVALLSASASASCVGTTCAACLADSSCGWTGSGCTSNGPFGFGCTNLLCGNPYICPDTPPAYDESFARNQLWRLHGAHAAGATTDDPSFIGCYKAADSEATFAGRVKVTCGFPLPTDNCTTDVFILPTHNAIVAATLGSNGLSQTLQVALQFVAPLGSPTGVLKYWANAYNALWTGGVQTLLQGLLTDTRYTTYKFVAVGHSIGATVAVQMAKAVSDAGWRDATTIQTITFGQPRIGNTTFLQAFYAAAPNHLRIINQNDLITTLPAKFSNSVEHTKFPVRYASGMSSAYLGTETICNTNEGSGCAANALHALQGDYHNAYFGTPAYADWRATNCSYDGI